MESKGRFINEKNISLLDEKGDERVEEVDKLIEALAIHISGIISVGKESEHEIAEKTKALAELVSARANLPRNRKKLQTTAELASSVSKCLRNIPEDQKHIELTSSEIFQGKQIP